jgi:glycosyltransferase involved in cell wall biosynthesis
VRILFVSHYALPHLGGIEVVVDQLGRELVKRGHEVVQLAAGSLRKGERRSADPPYRVVRLPAANPFESLLHVPYPLIEPVALSRALARELPGADVVHAHGMLYAASFQALGDARRRNVPGVLTEHAGFVPYASRVISGIERMAIATVGRATIRRARTVVAVGTRAAGEVRRVSPQARVIEIDNGVDLETFRMRDAGERRELRRELGWDDAPRALFVGRLVEKKGAPLAIEAARRSGVRLTVVGPGSSPAGDIDFLGPRSHGELARIYAAADVFLQPSHGEGGFPLTAREAMACGTPVVVADDPTYRSQVPAGLEGVRFVAPSADAVAEATGELLAMGDRARRSVAAFAASHFSWARAAEAHLALYEELIRS